MPTVGTVGRAARMPLLYKNFPEAFRNRARPYAESDQDVVYRLRNGLDLIAAPGPHDVKIINEIWLDRDYAALGFVPQHGWSIVDLGANKGFFSSWALAEAPTARIHCYEPDPRNFRALCANMQRFSDAASMHQKAIGSSAGSLTLFRLAGRGGQASVFRSRAESRGEIVAEVTVEVASLADLLSGLGDVDLLKIDVEGAEYDILLNSPPDALARVKRIVVEADDFDPANRRRRVNDLLEHLRELGLVLAASRRTVRFLHRR